MRDAAASSIIRSNLSLPGRPARIVAAGLLATSVFYAGIAATRLTGAIPPTEGLDVFIAGALPGLLLVLLLWISRPDLLDRRLRRRLIAISLGGAAIVASLPLLIAAA